MLVSRVNLAYRTKKNKKMGKGKETKLKSDKKPATKNLKEKRAQKAKKKSERKGDE